MSDSAFSLILFVKEDGLKIPEFPFSPDAILGNYSFNFLNFNKEDKEPVYFNSINSSDITGEEHLMKLVAFAAQPSNHFIFTVHPNAVLIPLYRWYLFNSGYNSNFIDVELQRLSRRVIDLCDSFYKPSILTLEKRKDFSSEDVCRWIKQKEVIYTLSGKDRCIAVMQDLCHRL